MNLWMKSFTVKIQMKATEQCLLVVLFIMLHKVVVALNLSMKSYGVSIQIKATKQYFPVVLFILLYKVVLSFLSLYL